MEISALVPKKTFCFWLGMQDENAWDQTHLGHDGKRLLAWAFSATYGMTCIFDNDFVFLGGMVR